MRTIKKYKKYRGGIHPPNVKPLTKFNPLYSLYNGPETLRIKEVSNDSIKDLKTKTKSKTKKKSKSKSKSLLKKIEERQKKIAWLKMNRFKHLDV